MIEHVLLAIYGAIVIGGAGVIPVIGSLTLAEYRRIGLAASLRSVYFWIVLHVSVISVAIAWICIVRGMAIIENAANLSGYWQLSLIPPFAVILAAKTGLNWAAARSPGSQAAAMRWTWICIMTVIWWIGVAIWGVVL